MYSTRFDNAARMVLPAMIAFGSALTVSASAAAASGPDFSNPGTTITADSVIASGACIAKYAALMDDASRPAAEIGRLVANRCAALISRSAGMAALLRGRPDEFSTNLRYMRDELTTNTVIRYRMGAHSTQNR